MFINSQFTCLWLAQTLSQIATNTLVFFIGFFIYKKTTSNIAVSLTLLAFLIPSFLSSILAGVTVSRMGKKWVLFLSNIFRALIVFLMFFAEKNFFCLYILMFFLALTAQFFAPAESSIIPQVVPKDKLITANAYFSTTGNLALIVGVLLSPILFKLFAYKTLFFILFMFLGAAASIYFLRLEEPLFYTNFKQSVNGLAKKFHYHLSFIIGNFVKDKKINQNVFYIILFQVTIFILITLAPGFADKILRVPIEDLSFLIIFPTTIGFIMAAFVIRWFKKIKEKVLIKRSFLGISLIFLAIFLTSQLKTRAFLNLLNFFLLAIFGFLSELVVVTAYANLQKETKVGERAGYFGLLNAFISITSIIPVLLSGVLSDMFGVDKIVLLLALVFLGLVVKN